MTPIDTYREIFQKHVADGMSYLEASQQFDPEELKAVWRAELERGDSVQAFNHETGEVENASGEETLFDLICKAQWEERNKRDFEEQAIPLMLAGWTSEVPNPTNSKHFWSQTQIMSLYWRAPSKRPGKPGRRYLSTNQAFNAMMKAQP